MVQSVELANFKCFKHETVPFGPFTILAGLNGTGKSSVIQSLLLFRQIFTSGDFNHDRISITGDLVELGRGTDVLNEGADSDDIKITLHIENFSYSIHLHVDVATGEVAAASRSEIFELLDDPFLRSNPLLNGTIGCPTRTGAFNYLNAERFGPRKALSLKSGKGHAFDLGRHGEFVFDALLHHQDTMVIGDGDPRKHKGAPGGRLREQIEAWLAEVSPGVQLKITGVRDADIALGTYSFGKEGDLRSRDFRATNVGFGLSFTLPVIAALLAAPPGGMVLIENPEAHLHPKGQTMMGDLCARCAAAGVQVIIETHSDHVLNGARLAVKDKIISSTSLCLNYFAQQHGRTVLITPTVDADGNLSDWPEGFFDQHRLNTAKLVRRSASE